MEGGVLELGNVWGYANALQLIVTMLLGLIILRGCWSWHLQGSRGIPSKGSFGWPILGETLAVISCNTKYPFDAWLADHSKRFGTMFKTHLFMEPSIIMMKPEELKYFFDDPHKGLDSGAPWALTQIFGPKSVLALNGNEHTKMHKLLADSLMLPELRKKLPEMERLMLHSISNWGGNTVDVVDALQDILLKTMTLNFFGIPWEDKLAAQIVSLLLPALLGITSIPVYFPGSTFYKAIQARKELNALLMPIIGALRDSQTTEGLKYAKLDKFPYQSLLEHEVDGVKFSDAGVCDILVGTILAGIHAPTNTAAIALKYLTENPTILQKVQAETDELRKKKEESGDTVFSISDLKELRYTTQVYHEVLRITNITPGASRTATTDLNFNGYVIPKGWRILAALSPVHKDPEHYPEPSKFDPDRFVMPPNPKTYLPFGRGNRTCVGRDITRLLVLMTLYHICSRFTWKIVSPDNGMHFFPVARLVGKFELDFSPRSESV
ncbi:hypothetical protein Mapa_016553 [Marchantia paleacea]|nr:hypothetical protein Mapa_016553 [Marchantia paleacea]